MNNEARLRPSNAVRWTKCPGSIAYQNKLGIENTSSDFAKEGQDAHALAEAYLRTGDPVLFLTGGSDEMAHNIIIYTSYVKSLGGTQFYEQAVDLSTIAEEMKGTCDALVFENDTMHVIDLKYGIGNKIYAKDNLQLILYAIGAYEKFWKEEKIGNIKLHIVQPRIDHNDVVDISLSTLINYASFLKAAALTSATSTELCAGEAQCNFCPVKPTCPKLSELTTKVINAQQFPDQLSQKQIGIALENKKLIINWLNAVENYAIDELGVGHNIDGYKLVTGRGARKWINHTDAQKFLEHELGDSAIIKKLISVAQAERLTGKEVIAEWWHKTSGKPKLAKDSDERERSNIKPEDFEKF